MDDAARTPLFSPTTAATFVIAMLLATRLPQLPPAIVIAGLAIAGGLACAQGRRFGRVAGAALLGAALLMGQGAWRMSQQLPRALELQEATISGRIVALPIHEERRTRFDLRVDDADAPLSGRVLRLSWYDAYRGQETPGPRWQLHAGERWQLRVKLRAPRGLRNPGGFDGERQMLVDGISATGHVRQVQDARRLASAGGIVAWRERMSARMLAATDAPSIRFIAALALGDTRGLSQQDWEILRAVGLTHLIAISGFHVGLVGLAVAGFAWGIYRVIPGLGVRVPRRTAMAAAATFGAFGYLLATGASLPTLRTVLMIAFVAGAALLRRNTGVAQSVAAALIVVLAMEPLSVLRPGFWLSFGGVAWLAWCLQGMRSGHLRQFLAAQGVASLGLLPLAVAFFAQASLAGPIANLVAVPWWSCVVVPLSLVGTAAEMLHAGWGAPIWPLAVSAFDLSWPLFERMSASGLALAGVPESPAWSLPLAMLGVFAMLLPRGVPGRPLAGLLLLPLLWPATPRPAHGEFEILQVDVGQGTAILVRTRDHALLYDAGPASPDGGFDAGERAVLPALRALGLRRLDIMVLSHADADHAGGRDAVAMALPVARTLAPPEAPLDAVAACIARQGWQWNGVRFRFLHPTPDFPYLRNQSTCVLRVEAAQGAALLTGDIDQLIESRLLRLPATDLRADVVTVPHHGSGSSSSPAFVAATGARLALVSAGYANRFRHPRSGIVARWKDVGAQTLTSSDTGALRVRVGRDGIHWQSERGRRARFWDAVARQADGRGLSYRPVGRIPRKAPDDRTGEGRWLADDPPADAVFRGAGHHR